MQVSTYIQPSMHPTGRLRVLQNETSIDQALFKSDALVLEVILKYTLHISQIHTVNVYIYF